MDIVNMISFDRETGRFLGMNTGKDVPTKAEAGKFWVIATPLQAKLIDEKMEEVKSDYRSDSLYYTPPASDVDVVNFDEQKFVVPEDARAVIELAASKEVIDANGTDETILTFIHSDSSFTGIKELMIQSDTGVRKLLKLEFTNGKCVRLLTTNTSGRYIFISNKNLKLQGIGKITAFE